MFLGNKENKKKTSQQADGPGTTQAIIASKDELRDIR